MEHTGMPQIVGEEGSSPHFVFCVNPGQAFPNEVVFCDRQILPIQILKDQFNSILLNSLYTPQGWSWIR